MNMKDTIKPTFGVSINEGNENNVQGPDYSKRLT